MNFSTGKVSGGELNELELRKFIREGLRDMLKSKDTKEKQAQALAQQKAQIHITKTGGYR